MKTIAAIALGGALGAVARHFMNTGVASFVKTPFPWGTMSVNVLGCFVMGVLVAVFAGSWNPSQEARAFLTVGFLGGFTTFSAFSLDAMGLWTTGDVKGMLLYVAGSVVLSLAAVFLGSFVVWKFVA
ncbi:MAG: fluoride efflux transporter CrcB [Alphaproteobacteria bacterium]|nr:fluoride efflux transporter CrcB [Alphaproteobacteria bacterium]